MAGRHGTSTPAVNKLDADLSGGKFDKLLPHLKAAVFGVDN
jgi:hypothetical protein